MGKPGGMKVKCPHCKTLQVHDIGLHEANKGVQVKCKNKKGCRKPFVVHRPFRGNFNKTYPVDEWTMRQLRQQ